MHSFRVTKRGHLFIFRQKKMDTPKKGGEQKTNKMDTPKRGREKQKTNEQTKWRHWVSGTWSQHPAWAFAASGPRGRTARSIRPGASTDTVGLGRDRGTPQNGPRVKIGYPKFTLGKWKYELTRSPGWSVLTHRHMVGLVSFWCPNLPNGYLPLKRHSHNLCKCSPDKVFAPDCRVSNTRTGPTSSNLLPCPPSGLTFDTFDGSSPPTC